MSAAREEETARGASPSVRSEDATPNGAFLPADADVFSLVLGGPLYALYQRLGLTRPTLELAHRRIIAAVLITWVPLVLLTLVTGRFLGGVEVPLVAHVTVHARFLLVVPMLIAAEVTTHRRIRVIVRQFLDRGLVAPADRGRFETVRASALRLRDSALIEAVLLVFVYTGGDWLWRQYTLREATWYAADGGSLSAAGYWFVFVSLPISRFILLRWYFRLFVWYRFLWGVSRIRLRLNALHPDKAAGLGFLDASVSTLMPVLFAQTVLLASNIADHIWHQGEQLPQFQLHIVCFIAFLVLVALAPLFFFSPALAVTRRVGAVEYGAVASEYVDRFYDKWIRRNEPSDDVMLGTGDIQSLADLGNSFGVVDEMSMAPFTNRTVLRVAAIIALPFAPLLLTMVSVEDLVAQIVKTLL
jgi:hypothetical protein